MEVLIYIGVFIGGLALGVVIAKFLATSFSKKIIDAAESKADSILKDAELKSVTKTNKIIKDAEDNAENLRKEVETDLNQRKQRLVNTEKRLKQKESSFNKNRENLKKENKQLELIKENLNKQLEILAKKQEELDVLKDEQIKQLEKTASLSQEEAVQRMMKALTEEAKLKASAELKEIVEQTKLTASKQTKKILIETIQRTAAEQTIENSVSVFPLENDDIKGRIIGREGRNIRALEAATGVEIIVDDTPDAIVLSSFDPYRREIARLALHRLISDGRIHPGRIEEVVKKVKKQLEQELIDTGERTAIDLGVHGLHPELIKLVGKMKYRSSYGQNLLQHSREVANMCAIMASELGLNAKRAKRAGLLHDIGKVCEEQPEMPHALLGMELAKRYKEHPEVCNAIGAHHDEIEMTSLISPIIQACDAISGARPGARREIVEGYIQRLKELEELALSYNGVNKTFAIQAGRELRVIVESEKVSDSQADDLAFEIANKIQTEMQYPGQIKVTVIREKRSVSFAK